jgi:DNA-binding Lrp family transcriptional regulator
MDPHDRNYYKILSEIETGKPLTQRSLSREMGIALGLTNLLIKRLAKKGLIKTPGAIRGKRLKYLLTPAGIAEKARLSVAYLENTITLYTETRERIRRSLHQIGQLGKNGENRQKIVFFGADEIAEIAYITLDTTVFDLIAVVDQARYGQKFFGCSIVPPEALISDGFSGVYDRIVVTALRNTTIKKQLEELQIPIEKVSFL